MIAVINIGVGNIRSIVLAIKRSCPDVSVELAVSSKVLKKASKIIFPGQGSMVGCIDRLVELNLIDELKTCLNEKPFLGICLGQQLLLDYSEEGPSDGLGVIKGSVRKFSKKNQLKIPHMGWNSIDVHTEHPVFNKILNNNNANYFYFVHSYYTQPSESSVVIAKTTYGNSFPSIIAKDNIIATQFHPEKSSQLGLKFLKNFIHWNP